MSVVRMLAYADCWQLIHRLLAETQDAVEVSLNDPTTQKRMILPCRGFMCKHAQCFNLQVYTEHNVERQYCDYTCPVCKEHLLPSRLFIDSVFLTLLECFPGQDCVVIHLNCCTESVATEVQPFDYKLSKMTLEDVAIEFDDILNFLNYDFNPNKDEHIALFKSKNRARMSNELVLLRPIKADDFHELCFKLQSIKHLGPKQAKSFFFNVVEYKQEKLENFVRSIRGTESQNIPTNAVELEQQLQDTTAESPPDSEQMKLSTSIHDANSVSVEFECTDVVKVAPTINVTTEGYNNNNANIISNVDANMSKRVKIEIPYRYNPREELQHLRKIVNNETMNYDSNEDNFEEMQRYVHHIAYIRQLDMPDKDKKKYQDLLDLQVKIVNDLTADNDNGCEPSGLGCHLDVSVERNDSSELEFDVKQRQQSEHYNNNGSFDDYNSDELLDDEAVVKQSGSTHFRDNAVIKNQHSARVATKQQPRQQPIDHEDENNVDEDNDVCSDNTYDDSSSDSDQEKVQQLNRAKWHKADIALLFSKRFTNNKKYRTSSNHIDWIALTPVLIDANERLRAQFHDHSLDQARNKVAQTYRNYKNNRAAVAAAAAAASKQKPRQPQPVAFDEDGNSSSSGSSAMSTSDNDQNIAPTTARPFSNNRFWDPADSELLVKWARSDEYQGLRGISWANLVPRFMKINERLKRMFKDLPFDLVKERIKKHYQKYSKKLQSAADQETDEGDNDETDDEKEAEFEEVRPKPAKNQSSAKNDSVMTKDHEDEVSGRRVISWHPDDTDLLLNWIQLPKYLKDNGKVDYRKLASDFVSVNARVQQKFKGLDIAVVMGKLYSQYHNTKSSKKWQSVAAKNRNGSVKATADDDESASPLEVSIATTKAIRVTTAPTKATSTSATGNDDKSSADPFATSTSSSRTKEIQKERVTSSTPSGQSHDIKTVCATNTIPSKAMTTASCSLEDMIPNAGHSVVARVTFDDDRTSLPIVDKRNMISTSISTSHSDHGIDDVSNYKPRLMKRKVRHIVLSSDESDSITTTTRPASTSSVLYNRSTNDMRSTSLNDDVEPQRPASSAHPHASTSQASSSANNSGGTNHIRKKVFFVDPDALFDASIGGSNNHDNNRIPTHYSTNNSNANPSSFAYASAHSRQIDNSHQSFNSVYPSATTNINKNDRRYAEIDVRNLSPRLNGYHNDSRLAYYNSSSSSIKNNINSRENCYYSSNTTNILEPSRPSPRVAPSEPATTSTITTTAKLANTNESKLSTLLRAVITNKAASTAGNTSVERMQLVLQQPLLVPVLSKSNSMTELTSSIQSDSTVPDNDQITKSVPRSTDVPMQYFSSHVSTYEAIDRTSTRDNTIISRVPLADTNQSRDRSGERNDSSARRHSNGCHGGRNQHFCHRDSRDRDRSRTAYNYRPAGGYSSHYDRRDDNASSRYQPSRTNNNTSNRSRSPNRSSNDSRGNYRGHHRDRY